MPSISSDIPRQFGVEVLAKANEQTRQQGANNVKLIENAQIPSNEVQKARSPNSTISVYA
jgi:hypothetical protein